MGSFQQAKLVAGVCLVLERGDFRAFDQLIELEWTPGEWREFAEQALYCLCDLMRTLAEFQHTVWDLCQRFEMPGIGRQMSAQELWEEWLELIVESEEMGDPPPTLAEAL